MNEKYVPEYTYTDNRLSDTKKSFTLDVRDKSIQIGLYDSAYKEERYVDINLYEGLFNKNLAFYNYFDSKLYFYKDEAKEQLLGSYECAH